MIQKFTKLLNKDLNYVQHMLWISQLRALNSVEQLHCFVSFLYHTLSITEKISYGIMMLIPPVQMQGCKNDDGGIGSCTH